MTSETDVAPKAISGTGWETTGQGYVKSTFGANNKKRTKYKDFTRDEKSGDCHLEQQGSKTQVCCGKPCGAQRRP